MKKYLVITNQGEIEEGALRFLGGSDKPGVQNKIGYFGSGNKYALSFFARNKYDITIYSGLNELKITTRERVFRNKAFQIIHINERETDITTEFGKDWKLWQAFREIYSNAIDEGNATVFLADEYTPAQEKTVFVIGNTTELNDLYENFDEYFSFRRCDCLFSDNKDVIHERLNKESGYVYRKGIRVYEDPIDTLFDYDFNDISIDESRITGSYNITSGVSALMRYTTNVEMLAEFLKRLNNNNTCVEFQADWNWSTYSNIWPEVLKGYTVIPEQGKQFFDGEENPIYLPHGMVQALENIFKDKIKFPFGYSKDNSYKIIETTTEERELIDNCILEIIDMGYSNIPEIHKAKTNMNTLLGFYDIKKKFICLTDLGLTNKERCFKTIFHELCHHISGYTDKTREFEEWLINELIKSNQ